MCDPAVQFQLWVRGDVGLSNLKKKLMKSVEHALCDYLLEYFVLVMPLTPIPCVDLDPDKTVDAEEVDTDKYHEWAIVTVSHPTPGEYLLVSLNLTMLIFVSVSRAQPKPHTDMQ